MPAADHYAVIGNPIAHSRSPQIHAAFAAQTGQAMTYEALLAPPDGFTAAVAAFRAAGGRGMNVTLPFKLEAHALADRLTPRARAAGAVNTLVFCDDGVLGDNTDGAGLVRDIETRLACPLQDRRILLLGAGGAARGVLAPLLACAPAALTITNRDETKAAALAAAFAATTRVPVDSRAFAALAGLHFDIVINATAVSLSGQPLPLPPALYAEGALAYDMMYGDTLTPFLAAARADGAARTADGLGMLIEQAAESFTLWRGIRPDTAPVLALLRAQ